MRPAVEAARDPLRPVVAGGERGVGEDRMRDPDLLPRVLQGRGRFR
ncbi:MAG: hypothetical protein OWU84_11550 [Firmicutes bacterium]|nr:hypothetical protein [Bacillota bacterium]